VCIANVLKTRKIEKAPAFEKGDAASAAAAAAVILKEHKSRETVSIHLFFPRRKSLISFRSSTATKKGIR